MLWLCMSPEEMALCEDVIPHMNQVNSEFVNGTINTMRRGARMDSVRVDEDADDVREVLVITTDLATKDAVDDGVALQIAKRVLNSGTIPLVHVVVVELGDGVGVAVHLLERSDELVMKRCFLVCLHDVHTHTQSHDCT